MGNQQSASSSANTTEQQQEGGVSPTPTTPVIIPKLAPPTTSFLDLPLSSFRIQELFAESRYCRYLRDVMTTLHHSPESLQNISKENKQSLYALYWSCLLSTMDKELNECLPATISLDKMASDLMMSRFDSKVEGALMNNTVVKCHDQYFDRYEQFIDKHFIAAQNLAQDQVGETYTKMVEQSKKEKLDIGPPTTPLAATAVKSTPTSTPSDAQSHIQQHLATGNVQQQQQQQVTVSPAEAEAIRAKYNLVSAKYCTKPSIMMPNASGNPANASLLITPQQFEEYYRYRMCMIAHLCSSTISQCMKNEKKGLLDCINYSPTVTSDCVNRVVKSGLEL